MLKESPLHEASDSGAHQAPELAPEPSRIRDELRRIVSSRHFQTSRRGKEFLQYVVDQMIKGHGDLLKERSIGTEIFGRKADYSTGEDPVVRVQAGDVRRRLERYYADAEVHPEIVIRIPVGSYAPVFELKERSRDHREAKPHQAAQISTADLPKIGIEQPERASERAAAVVGGTNPEQAFSDLSLQEAAGGDAAGLRVNSAILGWSAVLALVCLGVLCFALKSTFQGKRDSVAHAFWLPASTSAKPILLCLPRPMVYRPSDKLFDRYSKAHPDAFTTRESRQDELLPFESTETLQWADMLPVRGAGPGIGGVIAAINMSRLLTEQGIRFELRFGKEATYAEMRDSPVVIIGGINTEWTTQLISEASFAFDETRGSPNIHENGGAKRVWRQEARNGRVTRDYGLITRQLAGRAGQFLVQVAGISHFGTAAASELLVRPQELEKVLRIEGIDLRNKNLQVVVSTDVTDERAGPPHIVAVSAWQ